MLEPGYPFARLRLRLRPTRRARRRLRAAFAALCFGLGAVACAAFGGQSGALLPNVPLKTLGGSQLWTDVAYDGGWKVQRHVWTGHARLLDPAGVRRAWGDERACRGELASVERTDQVDPGVQLEDGAPPSLVILVHGLGRSHRSLGALQERLEGEGHEVLAFEYASTRGSLEEHAEALAGVLAGLDQARTVSFVTHSLGGLVLRELTRDPGAPWRARHRLGRAVTLAAPHGGAAIAAATGQSRCVRSVLGPAFVALGDGDAAALPAPGLEFATVAGVRGDGRGWNPWVAGDDDGLVAASEARLAGSRGHLDVPVAHTFIMSDPRVLDAVARFLAGGPLVDDGGEEL